MMAFPDWLFTWETFSKVVESNFMTGLFGAMAGAWAGARAAQRITDRIKRREFVVEEVRKCNAAMELAVGVCTATLSMKQQYIQAMRDDYNRLRAIVAPAYAARMAGRHPGPLHLGEMEMNAFEPLHAPVERLVNTVFSINSLLGRARAAMMVLTQSVGTLNNAITTRNELMESWNKDGLRLDQRLPLWFALERADGSTDGRFAAAVDAIYRCNDDCIFYSKLVVEDLHKHGRQLRATLSRREQLRVARINAPDFHIAERQGLLPDPAPYADWLSSFFVRVPVTRGRRLGRTWYAVRSWWRGMEKRGAHRRRRRRAGR
jgi:hypothetical protein